MSNYDFERNWQNPTLTAGRGRKPQEPSYSLKIPEILRITALLAVTILIVAIILIIATPASAAEKTDDIVTEKYGVFPKVTYYSPVDISKTQEALGLEVDGVFGEETEKAVKNFQSEVGLPATGVVDNTTADYLGIAVQAAHTCYQVDLEKLAEETNKDFIIYVNLYYRTLSVFREIAERWIEIGTVSCAIGAEGQETPVGIFEIYDNGAEYFEHGGYLWCHPSFFNGEYGIHSVSFDPESGFWGTEVLGESVSLGCIRVDDVVAQWLQYTCPLGTPVAIDDRV